MGGWGRETKSLEETMPHSCLRHRSASSPNGHSQVGAAPGLLGMVGDKRVITFYQIEAWDARGIGERRS